ELQKDHKLVVNGIADEVTLDKINHLNTPLKKGMRHADVKALKKDLAKLGFKVPGNGTNLYGTKTEKKVKELQKYYGIKQTGTVNNQTKKTIDTNVNSPLQKGKRHKDTKKLKKDLKKIGYTVPGNGTNLYGTKTANKIKELQKDHKLVVNGIADEVTLDKINHLNTPLKKGMRHADVKALKKDLAKLGFKVPGNGTNLYGTKTEKKVKELQKYYGIKQTGTVNNQTKKTIDTNVNSPLQKGKRHKDTKKLKKDLKKIGYTVPGNGTNLYGTKTANKIKELQKDYKLVVNGIADEVTLERIAELTKKSNYKTEYTNYNLSLNDALNIQMDRPIVITDKYGKDPAYVSANYLRLTGPAKVSGSNVNIRTAPNSKKNNIAFTLKKNEKITITGTKTGSKISGSTLWYQFSKKGKKYYIHSSLATGAKAKATATVN